jgi:hypothetical protein
VAAYTPAADAFSVVNRSRCAHGSHVTPSIVESAVPVVSCVPSRVTRCAASASRLMRVMYPGDHPRDPGKGSAFVVRRIGVFQPSPEDEIGVLVRLRLV